MNRRKKFVQCLIASMLLIALWGMPRVAGPVVLTTQPVALQVADLQPGDNVQNNDSSNNLNSTAPGYYTPCVNWNS